MVVEYYHKCVYVVTEWKFKKKKKKKKLFEFGNFYLRFGKNRDLTRILKIAVQDSSLMKSCSPRQNLESQYKNMST